jgi:CubicO group peptidase (beta-lactamase class C family)
MDLFRSPTFDSRVKQLIDKHHIPGIALAITQHDEIVSAAYGLASVKYARSMTTDTLFDIASASKSLTAASVALFVEDNNHPDVKYDARMSDLLPGDFEMPGEDHNGVTLDDLLGHRTGLAS